VDTADKYRNGHGIMANTYVAMVTVPMYSDKSRMAISELIPNYV